jgi:PKD repeat protein
VPVLPAANFSTNTTQGKAPLFVQFTDFSQYAAERNWDFENDGYKDSIYVNPVHMYIDPGNYTVNLTAINENGTDSVFSTITVLEQSILPVANFSTNITQGPAPLPVQFTDLSENAVSWSWDFDNNGQSESSDKNPAYVYVIPGTYVVNLTVSNGNGTDSKLATINVTKGSDNNSGDNGSIGADNTDGSSSGGLSHRSSSGNRVAGISSEPASNVETKEISQTFVPNGNNETEKELESESSAINESNALNKGPENKPKESPGISGFEMVCGVACLLGAFLYRKK